MNLDFTLSYCMVSLIGLGLLVRWWFGTRLRETYRTRIYSIRASLFDHVADNGRHFDDAEYQDVRRKLDGFLQISNTLSPVAMLFAIIHTARMHPDGAPSTVVAGQYHEAVRRAMTEAIHHTVGLVLFGSLSGWLLSLICILGWSFSVTRTLWRGSELVIDDAMAMTISHGGAC